MWLGITVVLICCADILCRNALPHYLKQRKADRIANELANELKADVRYSKVCIWAAAKPDAYLECSGPLESEADFKSLCLIFDKYSSNCPIHNAVYVVPRTNTNQ